jgi:adenylylsulfate reductase subunit A
MMAAEPYFIGSHASHAGMWVSGPADLAPPEWNWGYNRMTTIKGLCSQVFFRLPRRGTDRR